MTTTASNNKVVYWGTGRRKTSVARVRLIPGEGKVTINGRPGDHYLNFNPAYLAAVKAPLQTLGLSDSYDILVNVFGGGLTGQADAIKQGAARALRPEILVVEGLCTHLGCAPKFRPEVGAADLGGADWQGGFFCPCHGSKFDMIGRVYAGVPAPTNLSVPPHYYENEDVLVIGEEGELS